MTRSFFSIGTFHMHIAIPAMAASCRSFGTAGDIGSTRPTDLAETRTVSQTGTRIGSNTVTNIQTFAPLVSIGICAPLKISTTLRYTIIIFLWKMNNLFNYNLYTGPRQKGQAKTPGLGRIAVQIELYNSAAWPYCGTNWLSKFLSLALLRCKLTFKIFELGLIAVQTEFQNDFHYFWAWPVLQFWVISL